MGPRHSGIRFCVPTLPPHASEEPTFLTQSQSPLRDQARHGPHVWTPVTLHPVPAVGKHCRPQLPTSLHPPGLGPKWCRLSGLFLPILGCLVVVLSAAVLEIGFYFLEKKYYKYSGILEGKKIY